MKLIALKQLSKQIPIGATFELSDRQGKALIALKIARAADADPIPTPRRTYRRRDLHAED